jgi:cellulose synthase/poly-beta-1,6-N-acetylglucosamine synthase-like glycosyltransferase
MWVFYFFSIIAIWLGFESLRGGVRYLRYVKSELSKPLADFTPRVSIIAPCRGLDQGLKENLEKLFLQDYPEYEIVFVTDSARDESLTVIEELRREFPNKNSNVVIAGPATDSGQKVHNLIQAVKDVSKSSEVFVFVDSDARPNERWLRHLVAPLAYKEIGAATGYRWFFVEGGGFSSHLRSAWNASITSQLGVNVKNNFCWGGSTAIRRETFERLNMLDRLKGTLSDDFALTKILQKEKLPIHFAPRCLTASIEDCSFREMLEFTTRQMKITRVYSSHLWKAAMIGSLIFISVFFGGIALVLIRALLGLSFIAPLIIVSVLFLLGVGKAWVRLRAVGLVLEGYERELRKSFIAQITLWPVASALYLHNCFAAAVSRKIVWRGIEYELKSANETVIIRSVTAQDIFESQTTTQRKTNYER